MNCILVVCLQVLAYAIKVRQCALREHDLGLIRSARVPEVI